MRRIFFTGAFFLMLLIGVSCQLTGCGEEQNTLVSMIDGNTTGTENDEEVSIGEVGKNADGGSAEWNTAADGMGEIGEFLVVQVAGAVKCPGVYELAEGARIVDAIEAAGGLTPEAVFESVNQAEILKDEQAIYIYTVQEWESMEKSAGTQNGSGRININTASREELMTLTGIGAAKADSIIAYRQEHGNFSAIEDLMKIAGIKNGVFDKIKENICVN